MMEESTKFILITKHSNNVASERANEISNSLVLYVLIIFSPSSVKIRPISIPTNTEKSLMQSAISEPLIMKLLLIC